MMQAVVHRWPTALACAVCTTLAVSYTNDSTLTEEVLLEPCSTALSIEQGAPQSNSNVTASDTGVGQLDAAALPLSMLEAQMGLPRPRPTQPGLAVQFR